MLRYSNIRLWKTFEQGEQSVLFLAFKYPIFCKACSIISKAVPSCVHEQTTVLLGSLCMHVVSARYSLQRDMFQCFVEKCFIYTKKLRETFLLNAFHRPFKSVYRLKLFNGLYSHLPLQQQLNYTWRYYLIYYLDLI